MARTGIGGAQSVLVLETRVLTRVRHPERAAASEAPRPAAAML